jgi:hypothetical protein
MNERDIELAEQAGLVRGLNQPFDSAQSKFADLIRADELEVCAKSWFGDINKFIDFIRADERAACAKLCDEARAARLAEQIRARGNT